MMPGGHCGGNGHILIINIDQVFPHDDSVASGRDGIASVDDDRLVAQGQGDRRVIGGTGRIGGTDRHSIHGGSRIMRRGDLCIDRACQDAPIRGVRWNRLHSVVVKPAALLQGVLKPLERFIDSDGLEIKLAARQRDGAFAALNMHSTFTTLSIFTTLRVFLISQTVQPPQFRLSGILRYQEGS